MPGLSSSSGASFNDLTPEDGREDPDDGKELSGLLSSLSMSVCLLKALLSTHYAATLIKTSNI